MTHSSTDQICPCLPQNRRSLWARLQQARGLHRQRRNLAQLSDAQLRDIGLTRDEALAESQRSAWDVPQHWRG